MPTTLGKSYTKQTAPVHSMANLFQGIGTSLTHISPGPAAYARYPLVFLIHRLPSPTGLAFSLSSKPVGGVFVNRRFGRENRWEPVVSSPRREEEPGPSTYEIKERGRRKGIPIGVRHSEYTQYVEDVGPKTGAKKMAAVVNNYTKESEESEDLKS